MKTFAYLSAQVGVAVLSFLIFSFVVLPGSAEAQDHGTCYQQGGCGSYITPTPTIYASPNPVSYGGYTIIYWDNYPYRPTEYCYASGGWSGSFYGDESRYGGYRVIYGLTATNIFYITCIAGANAIGSAYTYVYVTPPPPPPPPPAPVVILTALPATVPYGGSATLAWTVQYATVCAASGNWSGYKSPSGGTEWKGNLIASQSYYLSCTGPGGTVTASAFVSVTPPPPAPVVTLSAAPTTVPYGGPSTLTWTVGNAASCAASGGWSGAKSISGGTEVRSSLTASQSYYLSCTGPGGTASANTSVYVTPPPPAPTVTLSANPTTALYGGSSTLTWVVQNATSCTASGGWSGSKSTIGGSQLQANILQTTTYTLACTGPGGNALRSATVTISAGSGGSIGTCDGISLVRRAVPVCLTYNTGTSNPAQCVIKTGSQTIQSNLSQTGTFTHSFLAETPITLYCDGGAHIKETTVKVVPEFQEV